LEIKTATGCGARQHKRRGVEKREKPTALTERGNRTLKNRPKKGTKLSVKPRKHDSRVIRSLDKKQVRKVSIRQKKSKGTTLKSLEFASTESSLKGTLEGRVGQGVGDHFLFFGGGDPGGGGGGLTKKKKKTGGPPSSRRGGDVLDKSL